MNALRRALQRRIQPLDLLVETCLEAGADNRVILQLEQLVLGVTVGVFEGLAAVRQAGDSSTTAVVSWA